MMLEGRGKIEEKIMSSLNLHETPVIGRKTIRLMISKLIYLFTNILFGERKLFLIRTFLKKTSAVLTF